MVTGLGRCGNRWTKSGHLARRAIRRRPANVHEGRRIRNRVNRIVPSDIPHVYTDGASVFTVNLVPGIAVSKEPLITQEGVEYRMWNPRRSKLAALITKGLGVFPFGPRTEVLYLGAGQGTTVSHISDICVDGTIYAVEISRRAFQKLLQLAERRPNVMPVLADAEDPEAYGRLLAPIDVLYQDVAQRDQVAVLRKNLAFLRRGGLAILMLKSRSADVVADPKAVYARARRALPADLEVLQLTELDPYEADHAAFVMEKS